MIKVTYQCLCMKEEVSLYIPARKEDEDIADWMGLVLTPSLYLHHRTHSPKCTSPEIDHVKVPITENHPIGAQVIGPH